MKSTSYPFSLAPPSPTNDDDVMSSHNTGIEWTHIPGYRGETWNPLAAFDRETGERGWFCTHVSEGCRNCYAERMNVDQPFGMGTGHEYKHQNLKKIEWRLMNVDQPIRWQKPRAVFVNSMTDLFHEDVPFEMIDKIFASMALSPEHIFLILTKRPERMAEYTTDRKTPLRYYAQKITMMADAAIVGDKVSVPWPLPNVWLGTSCEDQETADERVPQLLKCPAAVRFISAEPLLGPVDLAGGEDAALSPCSYLSGEWDWIDEEADCVRQAGLDWVIAGGESGPGARPMHPDWVRQIRDDCETADVPFFFKQWGAWVPELDYSLRRSGYRSSGHKTAVLGQHGSIDPLHTVGQRVMTRVGKKAAGRTLDGRTHDAFPQAKQPA